MRLLVLGVSAIALGACSVGGGYSWQGSQEGYDYSDSYYGGSNSGYYSQSGYSSGNCGGTVNPCGYTPPVYTPPCKPVPAPCPVYTPPTPPVTPPCGPVAGPCGGGAYSVTGHGHSYDSYAGGYGADYSSYGSYNDGYGYSAAPRGYAYGTLGAVMYDFEDEKFGLQGRLGYQFNPNLGAELEGSVGVIDETEDLGGGDELKTGVDYSAAAFGTVRAPLSNRLSALGRLGYHKTRLSSETTIGGVTTEADTDEDGMAYGVGVEYALSPASALRADYTAYEVTGGTLDSVSLAYLRRF